MFKLNFYNILVFVKEKYQNMLKFQQEANMNHILDIKEKKY